MLRLAHRGQTILGLRVSIVSTLGLRVRSFARETMQGADDRKRKAVCPIVSSCFLDSSLVLLLWNFGIEPWLGEFLSFGRIYLGVRASVEVLYLGKGGGAHLQL